MQAGKLPLASQYLAEKLAIAASGIEQRVSIRRYGFNHLCKPGGVRVIVTIRP